MDNLCENSYNEEVSLENIVSYLFYYGFLTDIECRKIVSTNDLAAKQSAILRIMVSKNVTTAKIILEVLRANINPLLSFKIVKRIFSFLNANEVETCSLVCKQWNEVSRTFLTDFITNKTMPRKSKTVVGLNCDLEINMLMQRLASMHERYGYKFKWDEVIEIEASIFKLLLSRDFETEEDLQAIISQLINSQAKHDGSTIGENDTITMTVENENIVAKTLDNAAVLDCIFGFLSSDDIQNIRIVSRKWNCVSETYFRNNAIRFRWSFTPLNFISVAKYSSLPDLPFSSFKISSYEISDPGLSDFFCKWRQNIKKLKLIIHQHANTYLSNALEFYFSSMEVSNLRELYIDGASCDISINLIWENIHQLETLYLRDVATNIDDSETVRQIRLVKIHLCNVKFFLAGKNVNEICVNEFINFSNAKVVYLSTEEQKYTFDWARDIINATEMMLFNIKFANFSHSNAKVQSLKLCRCELNFHKTGIQAKEFYFSEAAINFSALPVMPRNVEKLYLSGSIWIRKRIGDHQAAVNINEPIDLPNLKYLDWELGALGLNSFIQKCPNLEEFAFRSCKINLSSIPSTVKRMKITVFSLSGLDLHSDTDYIDLDLLILKISPSVKFTQAQFFETATKFLLNVRPNVLVLRLDPCNENWNSPLELAKFVQDNQHATKIITKSCLKSKSRLTQYFRNPYVIYVCNEFVNQAQRSITFEEFKSYENGMTI